MNKPVVKIDNFVRKNTQSVDVETLNQKGVTRVNFLTLSKINEMISLAVQRAVVKYQRSLDAADASRIQEEARAEIAEELKKRSRPQEGATAEVSIDQPSQTPPPPPLAASRAAEETAPPAESGAAALPPERPPPEQPPAPKAIEIAPLAEPVPAANLSPPIEPVPESIAPDSDPVAPAPVAAGMVSPDRLAEVEECIHQMIRDLLRKECPLHVLPDGSTTPADMKRLERELRSAVSRALAAERERLMDALEEAAAYRTELLERRLEKVKQKLREMEERLLRQALEKGLDAGLPSVHRDIQGLSLVDGQYEKKKGMLQIIFEENVQLQKLGGKKAV